MTPTRVATPRTRGIGSRLLAAGLLTAVVDGTFSSVLSAGFYHSTVARLFQGVAGALLGPDAINGGARTVAVGMLMHLGVAFGWSAVFLGLLIASPRLRGVRASRGGALKVASLYGPLVWMAMSLAVIPLLVHRPPAITIRWWVQFFGHIPFVALPIALGIGSDVPTAGFAAVPATDAGEA